jgi:hypothetical protein
MKLGAASLLGRQALYHGNAAEACQITRSGIEVASQSNLSWLELQLRVLLDAALNDSGQSEPSNRGRILYLLESLESGLSREPFRQAFLDYRNNLQGQLI